MSNAHIPKPIISLHGTAAATLEQDWRDVRDAAQSLIATLAAIEFNARDYSPESWPTAQAKMWEWRHRIGEIDIAAESVIGAIMDQRDMRGGAT